MPKKISNELERKRAVTMSLPVAMINLLEQTHGVIHEFIPKGYLSHSAVLLRIVAALGLDIYDGKAVHEFLNNLRKDLQMQEDDRLREEQEQHDKTVDEVDTEMETTLDTEFDEEEAENFEDVEEA